MADADEPKPEAANQLPAESEEEEEEEAGWPSWLSWGLVIVAAVFGGYLLGAKTGGSGGSNDAQQLEAARQVSMMKQEHKRALEQVERIMDQLTRSLCRELIMVGVFRDGLDERLTGLKDDLAKAIEQLGTDKAKSAEQLKKIDAELGKVAQKYSLQTAAVKKVGNIGTVDQNVKALSNHLVNLYVMRFNEYLTQHRRGDQGALAQARRCRDSIAQLNPKVGSDLTKQFPELGAAAAATTTKAPGTPKAPGASEAPAPKAAP